MHRIPGAIDVMGPFYLQTSAELDRAAARLVRTVIEVGLPIMREFDTLDKARRLFRDELAHTKRAKVRVLFAAEKLARIERH
jgi:hypothetical protein